MAQYSVKLTHKKEIADHMYELRFTKPEGFDYKAGQFIQFFFSEGEKVVPRSYSISSAPTESELEFLVKILEGGVASTQFLELAVGDELSMSDPQGRFFCNPEAEDQIFVATGSGMAPIMAMLYDELQNKKTELTHKLHLLFGVRSQKDIFWTDRLDALAAAHEQFSYTLTLSQPEEGWKGAFGRVTAHTKEFTIPAHYYLCGSAPMVMEMRKILIEKGCETSHMHFEIF